MYNFRTLIVLKKINIKPWEGMNLNINQKTVDISFGNEYDFLVVI